MLSGKQIILGVTGGIAAYKAAILLRALQKAGAEVRLTMTPAAARFVGVETFASLSKHEVAVRIFPEVGTQSDSWTRHISWGEWADLFLIAPCTANTLSKIAHGRADNMLTSTVLAARCPLLVCPTMDGEMYRAPATAKNLQIIRSFGYHILEPETGYLASGLEGKGRLPDTEAILGKAADLLEAGITKALSPETNAQGSLSGKKVLVTAGPTREHLDPVRYISNPSSGKMGFAMAEAAQALGAEVTLLHGPVALAPPAGIATESFESAGDLFSLVQNHADADVIIMAAAVADFSPKQRHNQKIKKGKGLSSIDLESTQDILHWLGKNKIDGQMLIGFAMETENLIENAHRKLTEKNLDWIAVNAIGEPGAGFETDTNTVQLIGMEEEIEISGLKNEVASQLLQTIFGGD
jgi:phosphopantothenoylcysteine decarboxylase/phosphopantothenate--cysteine ligase